LRLAGAALALAAVGAAATAADLMSPVGSGAMPPAPWRVVGLPQQAKPLPRFAVTELDDRRVLRVESDQAYGNLVHELKDAHAGVLSWRWRVDLAPAGTDLRHKSGDDSALKVCALFDMPLAHVPFFERQLLRLASWRTGEKLPTATLCYVWDDRLPQDALLHNAYTHRVRLIVAHGTRGSWRDERRDLAHDFRRAFGDEWRDTEATPPLAAILIGADSDNTGSRSLGYVSNLQHTPAARR
jgi:hypothetical protein